ncbi:MAG: 1-hydroxycarotenoid 3,4-desaturase CrtD [Pseudomonadota bacterium]
MPRPAPHITIIGAGIGGLASALRLSHAGAKVTVLERHAGPGGKMRTVPSAAGPVDAGPTVLTMKAVFEALFSDVGARLQDHVTLQREEILARHFWQDGTTLDLMSDPTGSRKNVQSVFGSTAAKEFTRFSEKARALFTAFDAPMMQSPAPTLGAMTANVLKKPSLIPAMAPHLSLAKLLKQQFSEPRLAQLFARYATYVGGLPAASPAILSLIWHAECNGVWYVKGGMHQLATAIEALAKDFGAEFRYNNHVDWIESNGDTVRSVHTSQGVLHTDAVLFNGDPRALNKVSLGASVCNAVPRQEPRSLSAYVHAFAAQAQGLELAAHNVFFADDPASEYDPLADGRMQPDPTLYVCAQDRFCDRRPTGPERFEIIMNAAPTADDTPDEKERLQCLTLISKRLGQFGLTFSPPPGPETLTMPQDFAQMFPASTGSLYGRSPHGLMAAFKRPTARTKIKGLYLTGGGAHPGAGVPMATLSAQHAAAAITTDLNLTSTSRRAATRGGMSTASPMTVRAPSRS